MFEKYFGQTEQFFGPASEIWALQTQAAESLTRTNRALMSEFWQGGLNVAQSLSSQKSLDDAIKLQQNYWADMAQKVQQAAQDNSTVVSEVSQKIAGVMQQTSPEEVASGLSAGIAKSAASAAKTSKPAPSAANKTAQVAANKPAAERKTAAAAKPNAAKVGTSKSGSDKSAKPDEKAFKLESKKAEAKTDDKKAAAPSSVGKAIADAHKDNSAAAPASAATPKASAAATSAKATGEKPAAGNGTGGKPEQGKSGQNATNH